MAKRKKQGGPAFNPVSFNVGNIQRAMDEVAEEPQADLQSESDPRLDGSIDQTVTPQGAAPEPPAAEAPHSPAVPAPAAARPAAPSPGEVARPAPRVDRTPVKRRRPEPAKRGKSLAAAAADRGRRDLYKVDYLRVFVDARQRRDLGRFVMDLNDALDVRLPETIIYRALLSIMQGARDQILAAAEAGEPLPATPARQDRLQMAEAEYRVARLLRDGILSAAESDLDALYHGRLESDDDAEYDEGDDPANAAA